MSCFFHALNCVLTPTFIIEPFYKTRKERLCRDFSPQSLLDLLRNLFLVFQISNHQCFNTINYLTLTSLGVVIPEKVLVAFKFVTTVLFVPVGRDIAS